MTTKMNEKKKYIFISSFIKMSEDNEMKTLDFSAYHHGKS